ncbi:MAG: hypothetical protein R2991_11175 [Thermoanaerobaculia bacterium]
MSAERMETLLAYPDFNDARGAAVMTALPPFDFQGAVMRVFPLRARPDVLTSFVDGFLNLPPAEMACFRPSVPYVLMMVIDYGRMEPEVANVGWVAQNEILFSIPLDWYRVVDGTPVFQDFATVSPYIFVDNDPSQTAGREIYGWQKNRAWLSPGIDTWARDPLARRQLLTLSTLTYDRLYSSRRSEPQTLLEIDHDAPPRVSLVPPDPAGLLNPLALVPRAVLNSLTAVGELADLALGLRWRGFEPDWASLPAKLRRILDSSNPYGPPQWFNTVNLKQFRDTESPEQACYQALVNSRMRLLRFNRGGMLGDFEILTGDPSGGFRIRLHRHPSYPIIETLGLEIEEEHEGDGVPVATLRPQWPSWCNVDLRYDAGERIAWRTRTSRWHTDEQAALLGADEAGLAVDTETLGRHWYNTATGPPAVSMSGPFRFPDTTVRVLPLLADRKKLQAFCDAYLNENSFSGGYRFEVAGPYVYMTIWNYDRMWSERDDIGQWAHRAVRFSVPVRWRDAGSGRLISMALLSPFAFADSEEGTHTGREVFGLPTVHAVIRSPRGSWLDTSDPSHETGGLLELDAVVLPALFAGQQMQEKRLFEVFHGDVLPENDSMGWLKIAETWGHCLKTELRRKTELAAEDPQRLQDLKALAVELLGNGRPVNEITLKQFRAVKDPTKACYQAIVNTAGVIDRLHDLREIERQIHLRIFRYASQPIVDTLGLVVKKTEVTEEGVAQILEPIRPFWLRFDLRIAKADNLLERTMGSLAMQPAVKMLQPRPYFQTQDNVRVGPHLVREIEGQRDRRPPFWSRRNKRQNLEVWSREWNREIEDGTLRGRRARPLALDDAVTAAETLEPQLAIESILSHEWGHWGNPRWYRRAVLGQKGTRQKPDFCVRRDAVGLSRNEVFPLAADDPPYRDGAGDPAGWFPGEKPLPADEDEDAP